MRRPPALRENPPAPGPTPRFRLFALALAALAGAGCDRGQRTAFLGDLVTERGEVLRDVRLGYRTFGTLAPDGGNAVLLLPWFMGTSRELGAQVGPGKLLDTRHHFVVAVDALGNGVSSSPSNHPAFPRLGMADLAEAEHLLVTRVLGLERLEAVVGVSMGGMQALAWATRHPGFARRVVAIAGSPRSSARDHDHWNAARAAMRRPAWRRALAALGKGDRSAVAWELRVDPRDHEAQAQAILDLDLTVPFGGSLERTAAAIGPGLLVVVAERDEVVDPAPARELARLAGAALTVVDGRCGHQAPTCEGTAVAAVVDRFLASPCP